MNREHVKKIKRWIDDEMTTEWEIIIMKSRLGAMIKSRNQSLSKRLYEAGILTNKGEVIYLCEILSYKYPSCECFSRIQKLLAMSENQKIK